MRHRTPASIRRAMAAIGRDWMLAAYFVVQKS
jgi:hypothetical protein